MNKNYFKYFSFLLSLISFFILLLIINQYFLYNVIYCDGNINPRDIVEAVSLNSQALDQTSDIRDANCSTIFTHYQEIIRRKLFWYACIESKGSFTSYNDYKQSWDPNTKVLYEIRKELKKEINDELYKMYLAKRTLNWFFKPSRPGGGRGL